MFYEHTLVKRVSLVPELFDKNMDMHIVGILTKELECTFHGDDGYILFIKKILSIRAVNIDEIIGNANFDVVVCVVTMKVERGDILDVVVTNVTRLCVFGSLGPLEVTISRFAIPRDLELRGDEHTHTMNSYVGSQTIVKGALVRVKILSVTKGGKVYKASGDMRIQKFSS